MINKLNELKEKIARGATTVKDVDLINETIDFLEPILNKEGVIGDIVDESTNGIVPYEKIINIDRIIIYMNEYHGEQQNREQE